MLFLPLLNCSHWGLGASALCRQLSRGTFEARFLLALGTAYFLFFSGVLSSKTGVSPLPLTGLQLITLRHSH